MMTGSARRVDRDEVPELFVLWCCRQMMRPFVVRSAAVRREGLSAREATDRIVRQAFGPDPVPAARRNLLEVLSVGMIFVGGVAGVSGVFLGILVSVLTASTEGHLVIRGVAMVVMSPLLAIGTVWAVRWALARRKWPPGHPPRGSQPRTHDVLLAAPLAILLATFFAVV
jgi:hypothetical protein